MSTTTDHIGQPRKRGEDERCTRAGWQESVRAWDLGDRDDLAMVAFPFTSRRIPRASRSHRDDR